MSTLEGDLALCLVLTTTTRVGDPAAIATTPATIARVAVVVAATSSRMATMKITSPTAASARGRVSK
jgi:hypothetical protein